MTPCKPSDRQDGDKRSQRRRQPSGPFGWKMKTEAESCGPIIKNWFFEPRLPIKSRRDPIACLGHGARNPGVAWFVGAEEPNRSEIAEEAHNDGESGAERGP